jgi:hypothetical protein
MIKKTKVSATQMSVLTYMEDGYNLMDGYWTILGIVGEIVSGIPVSKSTLNSLLSKGLIEKVDIEGSENYVCYGLTEAGLAVLD